MDKKLFSSEWILVGGLFMVMASMMVIAKINAHRSSSFLQQHPLSSHAPCEVIVSGAVKKPGTFKVPPGTLLKKILRKASLLPLADVKKIDGEARVEASMSLHIEELQEITVYLESAAGGREACILPAGAKVCDLKEKVEGGKTLFKSRRLLRDQEVFHVEK